MTSVLEHASRRRGSDHRFLGRRISVLAGLALGSLVIGCSRPEVGEHQSSAQETAAQATAARDTAVQSAGSAAYDATATLARTTDPLATPAIASVADVAERVVPSVVSISATRMVRAQPAHPFFREFGPESFGRPGMGPGMGPGMPEEHQQQGLGSGVIVTRDGVVLTNNHVVEQAEEVQVTLSDGRKFDAEVVGTDPQSDLAVVRIQGKVPANLQPLSFGDSSALRLGDVVLAIGNPFGVGQTVTMGIVSAKGRSSVGIVDYEDFIQTDAAINPGNSGGALVNLRGELVGIPTAILSRSGGYQGIGFAIPASMARPIMTSLLSDGKVARGWLGVAIQSVDSDLAAAMKLEGAQGVLISDVTPDSPAARAGLKRGDVIVALDGKPMTESSQLRNTVASKNPGSKVALDVMRNGKTQRFDVGLGTLPNNQVGKTERELGKSDGLLSGVSVANLTPELRARFNVPDEVASGVLVTQVSRGSRAQRVGLRAGDVILEFDRKPVDSVAALDELNRKAEGAALLLVSRQGNVVFLPLRE
jgi:serine protease Do